MLNSPYYFSYIQKSEYIYFDLKEWEYFKGLVDESVRQSLRSSGKQKEQLLDNLGKILQFQNDLEKATSPSPSQDQLRIVSNFSKTLIELTKDLLPMLVQSTLIPKVLKVLHFINLAAEDISVSLMHRTVQSLTFTLFTLFKEKSKYKEDKFLASVFQVKKNTLIFIYRLYKIQLCNLT